MKILRIFIVYLLAIVFIMPAIVSAQVGINLRVSPIVYRITANPGDTVVRTVKVHNPDNRNYNIKMWKSDFHTQLTDGRPSFVRKNEIAFHDQEFSTWMTFSRTGFHLKPFQTETVDVTIKIPKNATPGGHYAAVFFQDHESYDKKSGGLGMHVDLGVIFLLTVSGDIIQNGQLQTGGVTVTTPPNNLQVDKCALSDISPSLRDANCVLPLFSVPSEIPKLSQIDQKQDFSVKFDIPFNNSGNIHIAPQGKIILKNENGEIIKNIGRKISVNDEGAIIGQEIVDYLPINDSLGSTIPKSVRNYETFWKGFPFLSVDEKGQSIMKFLSPSEFYSEKNAREFGFLYPWQRLVERMKTENITAEIILSQSGALNPNEVTTERVIKNFSITYPVITKGIQPIAILILFSLLLIWGGTWWFFFLRRGAYLEGFIKNYLDKESQEVYKNSSNAVKRYLKDKNSWYRKGLLRDVKYALSRGQNIDIQHYIENFKYSYNPERENMDFVQWLKVLRSHLEK